MVKMDVFVEINNIYTIVKNKKYAISYDRHIIVSYTIPWETL